MATIRALRGDDPLSRSWKDYFFCCFMGGRKDTPQSTGLRKSQGQGLDWSAEDITDYGSGRHSGYARVNAPNAEDSVLYESTRTTTNCKSPSRESDDNEELSRIEAMGRGAKLSPASTRSSGSLASHASRSPVHSNLGGSRLTLNNIPDDRPLSVSRSPTPQSQDRAVFHNKGAQLSSLDVRRSTGNAAKDSKSSVSPSSFDQKMSLSVDPKQGSFSADAVSDNWFDISDLHLASRTSLPPSHWGSVRLTFAFKAAREKMTVTVHEARDIPSHHQKGGTGQTQVRMLLLPGRKVRQKTKRRDGDNPQFEETFEFRVPPDDLSGMGVRIRLYGCERLRRETMIGETILSFSSVNTFDPSHTMWINLEPRSSLGHGDSLSDVSSLAPSETGSSTQSMHYGGTPELLIGLSYNGSTGRMSVEVVKGSNFKSMAIKKPPDTYVRVSLNAPNGQEITKSKTSIRRGQPNPFYKETFVFQVAQFQLNDVSLMVSVFVRRSLKRKEMVGWFTIGHTSSSEEHQKHWTAMIDNRGEQVSQWHELLEP